MNNYSKTTQGFNFHIITKAQIAGCLEYEIEVTLRPYDAQ